MKPSRTVKLGLLFMQIMESVEAVSYSFSSPQKSRGVKII